MSGKRKESVRQKYTVWKCDKYNKLLVETSIANCVAVNSVLSSFESNLKLYVSRGRNLRRRFGARTKIVVSQ